MQNSLQSSEQITSHKALTEAGLPINEKNLSIVLELLANNMPIHKQSIMNILTQSFPVVFLVLAFQTKDSLND